MEDKDSETRAEISRIIQEMSSAWLEGRFDDLNSVFHTDVVAVPPSGGRRFAGRDSMVTSFKEFIEQAVVHEYNIQEPQVDLFGTTAIATVRFQIKYEFDNQMFDETGTDLFVFLNESGRWQIIWRTQIPSQAN